ncbi:hypothetical protein V1506DRAFT_525983, partial [Lipomyces tetrasporus]
MNVVHKTKNMVCLRLWVEYIGFVLFASLAFGFVCMIWIGNLSAFTSLFVLSVWFIIKCADIPSLIFILV